MATNEETANGETETAEAETNGNSEISVAETVGERIRRVRSEAGKTQRDISTPSISFAYISRIEAGARTPSSNALREIADQLGVTPLYLETGQEAYCPHCKK